MLYCETGDLAGFTLEQEGGQEQSSNRYIQKVCELLNVYDLVAIKHACHPMCMQKILQPPLTWIVCRKIAVIDLDPSVLSEKRLFLVAYQ